MAQNFGEIPVQRGEISVFRQFSVDVRFMLCYNNIVGVA